ncbi:hypothetical protein Trydic_g14251 [Trypoxylus dichotomus]
MFALRDKLKRCRKAEDHSPKVIVSEQVCRDKVVYYNEYVCEHFHVCCHSLLGYFGGLGHVNTNACETNNLISASGSTGND